jgi:hypothetical protein
MHQKSALSLDVGDSKGEHIEPGKDSQARNLLLKTDQDYQA